jgi:MtN3 and saliva related transmembrane protein
VVDFVSLVGYAAGVIIAVAYAPQVIRAYRTKSTNDLSIVWLAILFVGDAAWLLYGLLLGSLPIIASNFALILLTVALIELKLKYG